MPKRRRFVLGPLDIVGSNQRALEVFGFKAGCPHVSQKLLASSNVLQGLTVVYSTSVYFAV
jgi:hypothetical protein